MRVIGNELGFSLIDLLVASMMSVIIVSICYSVMAFQYSQLRAVRALYVQNILLARIKSASSVANLLGDSRTDPANVKLRSCLTRVDGACTSFDLYDFRLIDGGPVAGFVDDPVYYNLDAQRCNAGTPNCIFTLTTKFRVQCPALSPFVLPLDTCPVPPSLLEVIYEFKSVEDLGPSRVLGLTPVIGAVIVKL